MAIEYGYGSEFKDLGDLGDNRFESSFSLFSINMI